MSSVATETFQHAVEAIEQPQFSPLDVPLQLLSKCVRSDGNKVVHSGEGSDEIFGGYVCYDLNQIRRALSLPSVAAFRQPLMDKALRYYLGKTRLASLVGELYMQDPSPIIDLCGAYPAWYPFWEERHRTFKEIFESQPIHYLSQDSCFCGLGSELKERYSHISDYSKTLYLDLKTRLPSYILPRADKNSMVNSVEARVPYLSNNVIDFCLCVPDLLKMFGLKEKFILRQAAKRLLPSHVVGKKKLAYNSPNYWLWQSSDEAKSSLISEAALRRVGIFRPALVKELLTRLEAVRNTPNSVEYETVSVALTGVLSTQMLHHRFCS